MTVLYVFVQWVSLIWYHFYDNCKALRAFSRLSAISSSHYYYYYVQYSCIISKIQQLKCDQKAGATTAIVFDCILHMFDLSPCKSAFINPEKAHIISPMSMHTLSLAYNNQLCFSYSIIWSSNAYSACYMCWSG